jgi:hypothetical protein
MTRSIHHSILLVIQKPAVDFDNQAWNDCKTALSDLANKETGVLLLAENVLLIPPHDTLRTLVRAVQVASAYPYKYSIIEEEIQWHKGGAGKV